MKWQCPENHLNGEYICIFLYICREMWCGVASEPPMAKLYSSERAMDGMSYMLASNAAAQVPE
jgi:hypothetical protein